ncbi:MAG: choice-of-anchor D domain-containing protein, partial [Deltaproteobacteria bacterium]|nr:choice-of-anchor D domain-containing protein [Deltaproteobacteria bacterium]
KISAWFVLGIAAMLGTMTGCDDPPKLVLTSCLGDQDCPPGQLCEQGVCVAASKFRCDAVTGGAGVLQPAPHTVDFGVTGSDPMTQSITLRNIGRCSLTLFEASLKTERDSPFSCEGCGEEDFPVEIFPMREKTLMVHFTAPKVGVFESHLELLSDDAEFPTLRVPLRARFDGVPSLIATPDPVKFGYVSQGADEVRVIQLANHGTGSAPVKVTGVHIEPSESRAFSLEESVTNPLPTQDTPATLVPIEIDPKSGLMLAVHYHPREVQDDLANVVIITDSPVTGTVRVALSGSSQSPPQLTVAPEVVDFEQVPIGRLMAKTLTLVNNGGSPLTVAYEYADDCPPNNPRCSTDFSFTPAVLPTIEPGEFFEMKVFVEPTSASNIRGLLSFGSNDPSRPQVTVPLSVEGISDGTQAVKVEISYENGAESAFDNDLRRLDASLESPYGFLCNKQEPRPTSWGDHGTPSWMALGAKLNPQRVILFNPKQDGTYKVLLQYTEDCSSLPSELLASVLGISVDALIAYLTGGVVDLDPGDVGGAIDSICLSRSATTANVTVWVNGQTIAERSVTLAQKGDYLYALDLVRENGQFSVP